MGTVTISDAIWVPGTIPPNPFRCIHQYWAQQNWWALLHTQGGPYEELWGASFMQLCPAHTSCFWSPWSLNSVSSPQKACQALLGSSCCVMAWKPNVIIWVKSRVYLFCFSSLKDRCPLMPDAQSLWKVLFQIFYFCACGGGKGRGVEEEEGCFSWEDKCNSCYSILAKIKAKSQSIGKI